MESQKGGGGGKRKDKGDRGEGLMRSERREEDLVQWLIRMEKKQREDARMSVGRADKKKGEIHNGVKKKNFEGGKKGERRGAPTAEKKGMGGDQRGEKTVGCKAWVLGGRRGNSRMKGGRYLKSIGGVQKGKRKT